MAKAVQGARPHPFFKLLRFVLILALISISGLFWYVVFLLARDTTDFWRVRMFCGIGAGTLFSLAFLIVAAAIILFLTGAGAVVLEKGLFSLAGATSIIILVFIVAVAGIGFAMMPIAKNLSEQDAETANASPDKSKLIKLAIAAAGFGTGIVLLYLLYYVIRGFISSKKKKHVTATGLPVSPAGGAAGVTGAVAAAGVLNKAKTTSAATVTPTQLTAQQSNEYRAANQQAAAALAAAQRQAAAGQ